MESVKLESVETKSTASDSSTKSGVAGKGALCSGKTKKGLPCTYKAAKGQTTCKIHTKQEEKEAKEVKEEKEEPKKEEPNEEEPKKEEPNEEEPKEKEPKEKEPREEEPKEEEKREEVKEEIKEEKGLDKTVKVVQAVEMTSTAEDILSATYWKNTKTFKSIKDKETQIKYYKRMNSCEEVLQLVDLESKPFGSESEKIIQEIFKLGPRTSSQNDGTRNGKKIEIKSARYWAGKDDCVWQHLEPEHDYEIALFALLDFQGWKVWGIKKALLMGEMRDKKIVTFQGKQGWWVRKSAILSYLTPIKNISELDVFIQS